MRFCGQIRRKQMISWNVILHRTNFSELLSILNVYGYWSVSEISRNWIIACFGSLLHPYKSGNWASICKNYIYLKSFWGQHTQGLCPVPLCCLRPVQSLCRGTCLQCPSFHETGLSDPANTVQRQESEGTPVSPWSLLTPSEAPLAPGPSHLACFLLHLAATTHSPR